MFRTLSRLSPIGFAAVFPFKLFDSDKVVVDNRTNESFIESTGWQRVKALFYIDEFKDISPELNFILQSGCMSGFVGGAYGAVNYGRKVYTDFISHNQATSFTTVGEAKKMLQDKVVLAIMKGGFKWGWRMALFTIMFTGTTTLIAVYRAKSSIVEYSTAGTVAGAVYKANTGMRGAIVGGTLGLILGTFVGATSLFLLHSSGLTMDQVHKHQYQWRQRRNASYLKTLENASEETHDNVTRGHDLIVKARENSNPVKEEII